MPSRVLTPIRAWLDRRREDVIDLALLWASLGLADFFGGVRLPILAQGAALAAAVGASMRRTAPEISWGKSYRTRLPGKLLAAAIAAAAFLFWFGLSWRALLFVPFWLALSLAGTAGARPLPRLVRRLAVAGAVWTLVLARRLARIIRTRRLDLAAGAGLIAAAGLALGLRLATPGSVRGWLAFALGVAAALLAYRRALAAAARRLADPLGENLRWMALALAAGWLLLPFLTRGQHGTDDARWYATMLADMRAQIRDGTLPVAVGQTEWQFNGAVFPFRLAPAYHYLGALLDTLTLRSLEPFALQHLLIVLVGFAGIFSAYRCLTLLLPGHRGIAAALAWLWFACPGVAGLAFNTDLYMTWTTLPAIPWVVLGWVRVLRGEKGAEGWLNLAIGLGWAWWGHTPIALWLSLLSGGVVLGWLAGHRPGPAAIVRAAAGGIVCLPLALFPVVSYLSVVRSIGLGPGDFSHTDAGGVAYFIGQVFPAVLWPMSERGRVLSDFQLGWPLWAALGWTVAQAVRARRAELWGLLGIAGALVLLLTPVPVLNYWLWRAVPEMVLSATSLWAMNRLYLILAMVAAAGAAAALEARGRAGAGLPRATLIVFALLLAWSGWEAGKFVHGSRILAPPPETGAMALRPENISVTRNAYLVFPRRPDYYSEGVVDPELENRLLAAPDGPVILANADAAAARAVVAAAGGFHAVDDAGSVFLELDAPVVLEPGRRYLLEFTFFHPETKGVLQFAGSSLFRQYALPAYGGDESFGAGGRHARAVPLWTSGSAPERVRVRFFPADPSQLASVPAAAWARVRVLDYDRSTLPVRIDSWLPYRARVRSPAAGWLETPRLEQKGYAATVNGAPVATRRSPQGLVAIPVPAGESAVELRYRAGGALRASFWISSAAWLGLLAAALLRMLAPRTTP